MAVNFSILDDEVRKLGRYHSKYGVLYQALDDGKTIFLPGARDLIRGALWQHYKGSGRFLASCATSTPDGVVGHAVWLQDSPAPRGRRKNETV